MRFRFTRWLIKHSSGLCLAVVIAGCSKKAEQPVAPAAAADAAPAAPAAAPPPAAPAPAAPEMARSDLDKVIAQTDAAIKAKDYEVAVQTFLSGTRGLPLTDKEAQTARGRMVQLQAEIASAAANGDPKARAAAQLLRRYSMQR